MSAASSSPATAAPRLRKPSWRDPRLLVGLLLVLASVASVIALVGSVDRSAEVYAARDDIAVGQKITPEDLMIVKARLGDLDPAYLSLASGLPENPVATGLLRKGELIARSAVGTADRLDRKPVGLTVQNALPSGTRKGSFVDVWVSRPDTRSSFTEPQLLLRAAEIAEVSSSSSALGASSSLLVHVLVSDQKMPALLAAMSGDAKIAVVPNPAGSAS